MEAHISLLNAHAHIQIHTYRHMKNGSAHFTTKCTHTHIYKSYIQIYEKWKRSFHNSMHTHIYKYIHTDI